MSDESTRQPVDESMPYATRVQTMIERRASSAGGYEYRPVTTVTVLDHGEVTRTTAVPGPWTPDEGEAERWAAGAMEIARRRAALMGGKLEDDL